MPRIFPISMSNPKPPRKPPLPTHPCTWWNVDPWTPLSPPPPPLTMCVEVALPVAVAVALAAIWDRCWRVACFGFFCCPIQPRPCPFAPWRAFVCSVADATVRSVYFFIFSTQLPETWRSETEAQRMHQTARQRSPEDPRVSAAGLGAKIIFKEKGEKWRQQVGEVHWGKYKIDMGIIWLL